MSAIKLIFSLVMAGLLGCLFFGISMAAFHTALILSLIVGAIGMLVGFYVWNE